MRMRNWTAAGLLMAAAAAGADEFPARKLRGYGTVSAESVPGKLTIHAENSEKAALWQAKYASDLTRTVGTVRPVKIDGFTAYELPGGGFSTAVRDGKTVTVVSGKNREAFRSALRDAKVRPTAANTVSGAKIPMYLDSFDQYAFRFYYRPGERPPNTGDEYDPTAEFDFAKKNGDAGFIFWANAHNADFAAGLSDENAWNWAYRLAKMRHLPIVLNTNGGGGSPSISNAFRSENVRRAPDYAGSFHAVGEPNFGGTGFPSWAAVESRKAELRILQDVIRKYGRADEVIEFLEPHGELNHGNYTVFLEYGPQADRSFREFLKERYKTLDAVSKRYGRAFKNWDEVKLPEVAEFFGWNERILNLAGPWKIGYLPLKSNRKPNYDGVNGDWKYEADPAPAAWFAPGFDDSAWRGVARMPGTDEVLFLPKQPAVLRRNFKLENVPAGRVWLYLWDLNQGTDDTVEVHLNGQKIAVDTVRHNSPHWGAYEVTGKLRAGDNLLALRLPKTAICYRVYLSGFEPKSYPALGAAKNALWADFSDWQGWSRNRAVELGMAAIREVDPDRGVVSMSPDSYSRQLREIARKYGSHFHNTGYMGGFFAEYLPMLMRGADLPMTLEPGGPASDLPGFKHMTGLYLVEGVNAIHYFIHVGNIFWNAPIREYFEKITPALKMLGRQHQEKADTAELFDSDVTALLGYPWVADSNAAFPSGYWTWRFNETLKGDYPTDGVTPDDFAGGNAAKYKIILDANNTVLRPETLAGIEKWVRDGGVFVSMFQTGRHSPEAPDSWLIQRLSGCTAKSITRYDERNNPKESDAFGRVPGQSVFTSEGYHEWMNGDGVKLKPVADDFTPLLRWRDGTVAAGIRKVGKGAVITFGVRLPYWEARTRQLLCDVLRYAGAKPLELIPGERQIARHYVSNNGLCDVWVLWNEDRESRPYEFKFRNGVPAGLTDVVTGKPAELKGTLPGNEFKMLISPRPGAPADAAAKWFGVKYGWWQGAEKPAAALAGDDSDYRKSTLPLTDGWELRELAPDASVEATFRDRAAWRQLKTSGALLRGIDVESPRLLLKRTVTVPKDWKQGEISLWCTAMYLSGAVNGQMKFFLNGREIAAPGRGNGVANLPLAVKPGETFTLGIEVLNDPGLLRGVCGATFLHYQPAPERVIPLKGVWRVRRGTDDPKTMRRKVPGLIDGNIATRTVQLDPIPEGRRVFLHMTGDPVLNGVIVNGQYVRRHHHMIGSLTDLDITPWIKPGDNEISIVAWQFEPNLRARIRTCELQIRK